MKRLHLVLLIFLPVYCIAQIWSGTLAYHYLYSKKWDRMIQTYNFSRPFLENEQALLMHGVSASGNYFFKGKSLVKHGIHIGYDFFRSKAENTDFINVLHLQFSEIGYQILREHKGNYYTLGVNALGGMLTRRVNEEAFEVDDKRVKALGIGGQLTFSFQHYYSIHTRLKIAPSLTLYYTPYFYAPKTEAVINQTRELVSTPYTGMLGLKAGVRLWWISSVTNEQKDVKLSE
jgi:hypothetical protein